MFINLFLADEFETKRQNPRFKPTKPSPMISSKSFERANNNKFKSFKEENANKYNLMPNTSKCKFSPL